MDHASHLWLVLELVRIVRARSDRTRGDGFTLKKGRFR